jgi:hypothetical protein
MRRYATTGILSAMFEFSVAQDPNPGACDERCEVETVGRTSSLLVGLEAARCALDEPGGTDGVATRLMGQAHAQLRQALPQLAFLVRARLPPDLEGLVRREGTPLVQQSSGVCQGRFRRKRFFGDGLNARCAIRQGSTERVAWSGLLCSPLFVPIAIAGHVRPLRNRQRRDGVGTPTAYGRPSHLRMPHKGDR